MSRRFSLKLYQLRSFCLKSSSNRSILSQAYLCEDEWEKRKQSNAMKDVEPYELINSLLVRSQNEQQTTSIDLDIAANALNSENQLGDFEEVLFRYRHSRKAVSILDSTHHALVRIFLQFNKEHDIVRYLGDSINYGLFPDSYAANMLMDKFLVASNTRDAAKVACFMMQQEAFQIESSRLIMLHSCLAWLKNPDPSEWLEKPIDTEASTVTDDDEEILFRVPFLKSDYFDDHFDLEKPEHLVGKTLCWTSRYQLLDKKNTDIVMSNCQLLGAILWQNEPEIDLALKTIKNGKISIFSDLIELATKMQSEENDGEKSKIALQLIENLPKTDQNLFESLEKQLKIFLVENESHEIENQQKLYKEWDRIREHKIDSQIKNYLKQERLKIVQKQLDDLNQESEHMFFFENKEELEKRLPPKVEVEEKVEEKLSKAVVKKKSATGSKSSKKSTDDGPSVPSDEDYVVPELKRSL